MAGLGAPAFGGEQPSVMVSSLPLVFCDGRPVALENMPDRSLVKFVRFMLKCAIGVDESRMRMVRRPTWWPRTLPYFNFKASSEIDKGHAERLRELVRCCYRSFECEYLVRFCADLERHCMSGRMAFKNNFDGSSSLYELATNRLVVTCRNENLEYDRSCQGPLSPRRHLLPRQLSRSASQLAMVQPPPDDIFLCDTCSAEFSSVDAVQAHERQCGVPAADEGPPSDTESVVSEPEVQCASQTRFLSYVGLAPADGSGKTPYFSPSKRGGGASAAARLRRGAGLLIRYPAVDVSSPLGRRLGAGPPPADDELREHERYCEDSERKRLARQPSFPVSWRPPRKGRRIVYGWSHMYCFTAVQCVERRRTIRAGLTEQARQLARTVLPCSVRLTRLTAEEIKEACRPRPRPVPVHPVWKPPASVQRLLWRPTHSLARPGPWRTSDRNGARAATSALTTAAAATAANVSDSASAPREFQPTRSGVLSVTGRSGVARTYSLPPDLSITPQWMAPRPQGRAAAAPFSQRPVWRPALVGAGGAVVRPTLVGGRGMRFPLAGGVPQRGRLKVMRKPMPSKPPIGKELRDNGALLIDLCSSSDEEGDPPPAAPPPPLPPPPRIKTEAEVTSPGTDSNEGTGWQPKNVRSHWSQSCEGLANGVSSFASQDAEQDGDNNNLSKNLEATGAVSVGASLKKKLTMTLTSATMDSGTIDAVHRRTLVTTEGDISCDGASQCGLSALSPTAFLTSSRKESIASSASGGPHVSLPIPDDATDTVVPDRHLAASKLGCKGCILVTGLATRWIRTIACHAV